MALKKSKLQYCSVSVSYPLTRCEQDLSAEKLYEQLGSVVNARKCDSILQQFQTINDPLLQNDQICFQFQFNVPL